MTAAAERTLRHTYGPRGSQAALFTLRGDEVLLSGPAGTGKSRACLEKLHLMCLLNPDMRGLIIRKTLASLGSTALETWRRYVVKESMDPRVQDVDFYGGSAEEPPQYRYSNGSVVVIGGIDKPSKIMSSEYDVIYVQEATELTPTDWQNLTTRLRNGVVSFQQLIADCNPDVPHHWLKQRCDDGITEMINTRHEENPILFNLDGSLTERGASYMAKLDNLTGVRKQRLRYGRWVAAEGIIYEQWDQGIHLVNRFPVPRDWRRVWSVDFGFTNPFVWQCWVIDPDGRMFLWKEIYRTKRLVSDHVRDILDVVSTRDPDWRPSAEQASGLKPIRAYEGRRWHEPYPDAIVCDHDAEDRATLESEIGMGTIPADKRVSVGIEAVQKRLTPAGDGLPRLALMRDALVRRDDDLRDAGKPTCTAEEIPGYVWKTPLTTAAAADKPVPEEPRKNDDHGCDAKRYAVAKEDLGSSPNIRWM